MNLSMWLQYKTHSCTRTRVSFLLTDSMSMLHFLQWFNAFSISSDKLATSSLSIMPSLHKAIGLVMGSELVLVNINPL